MGITARQLSFIDIATIDAIDTALARALDYLKSAQRADGSWWGRWSDSDVSATAEVLVALCAIDVDPSANMIGNGRQWLPGAVQRLDGLHAVETSWAAAALLASCASASIYQDSCASREFLDLIPEAVDGDLVLTSPIGNLQVLLQTCSAGAARMLRGSAGHSVGI
jgi:squalene cyclase